MNNRDHKQRLIARTLPHSLRIRNGTAHIRNVQQFMHIYGMHDQRSEIQDTITQVEQEMANALGIPVRYIMTEIYKSQVVPNTGGLCSLIVPQKGVTSE